MCYFIGIEDLVANALIELVEKTGKRTVSFAQLNEYGEAIIARLKKNDMDVTLLFTRDATKAFFHDCSDIFIVKEADSGIDITLKDGVSTEVLRNRFRINLALHLLTAFVSDDVLKTIIGKQ